MENSIQSIGNEKRLKLCLLGNTSVGKTALTNKFIDEKYQVDNEKTVEEQYDKYIKIKDEDCILQITDTGGLEDYQNTLSVWIKSSEGFLLVYSINDKDSFDGIKMRYEKIKKYKKKKPFSVIVVGNKNDLEKERQVDKEEVDKFCNENNLKHFEICSSNVEEINKIFMKIAKKIYKIKYPVVEEIIKEDTNKSDFCCRFC